MVVKPSSLALASNVGADLIPAALLLIQPPVDVPGKPRRIAQVLGLCAQVGSSWSLALDWPGSCLLWSFEGVNLPL